MSLSESIERLRARFESTELATNIKLYHPIDIDRVRTEQWQVKRFLLEQQTLSLSPGDCKEKEEQQLEERAFVSLCKSLQWKKSFGIHERSDQYYPKEFWVLNTIEVNGKTHTGQPVLWGTIKNKRSFKETQLLAKQFVAHVLERTDRLAGERGFTVVSDTNGASLINIDLELSRFNTEILEYYPQGMRAMYVVDLPWLLNAIMKIMMNFMEPQKRHIIHFIKSSELVGAIDPEYIPVTLKGNRVKSHFPSNLLPLSQCYSLYGTMDEKFVKHFYNVYKLKSNDNINLDNNNNNEPQQQPEMMNNTSDHKL